MSVVVADTHAVVWYLAGSSRLSDTARDTMRDAAANGAILVSAISLIEIVYLTESGRLPAAALERIIGYFLLDVPRRSLEVHTSKLADKILALGQLSEDDERSLLHLLDAIEAKNKLKELAANVG